MKKVVLILSICLFGSLNLAPISVSAQSLTPQQEKDKTLCESAGNKYTTDDGGTCTAPGRQLTGSPESFLNVFTNLLLYIAGAIAVIVIIVGGIRYITSTGDAMRIKQAKDTILYGIVGLIVAIIAWAIVKYIVDTLG